MVIEFVDEKQIEKNLEAFGRANPKWSVPIDLIDLSQIKVVKNKKGEPNLEDPLHPGKTLHDLENPLEEAEKWLSGLQLEHRTVLYVYGIGLGYPYLAVQSWLKEDPERHVIFLEDNLMVVRRFLETANGSKLLDDPQTSLHPFHEVTEDDPLFSWLAWTFIQKQIEVVAIPSYQIRHPEKFNALHHLLFYESAQKNDIIDEYLKYGIVFYRNFYRNIRSLHESFLAKTFFQKFSQVPAIICGAGPSLKHNLALLQTLKSRALIFAGGSALNAVSTNGFTPHFGAGVDPNPTYYYRLLGTSSISVPFFYRLRMQADALASVKGPKLYANGAGGYDTAEWFEKELGIEGKVVDEGHNVVNFCTEIALEMGCNPIIFVGMDLAYTDLQSYAQGVVEDPSVKEEELVNLKEFEKSAIKKQDIHGNTVYTHWKWIAEAEWLSHFAKENDRVAVINSTEGGLGFEGIANISLEEAAEEHLLEELALEEKIVFLLEQGKMPEGTKERVKSLLDQLKESLDACLDQLDILIFEGGKIKERIEGEGDVPPQLQTGLSALAESELEEEEAYGAVLDIFNTMYTHYQHREVQLARRMKDERERSLMLLSLNRDRFVFLQNVIKTNRLLLDQTSG